MNIFIFGGTGDLAGRKLLPALYRHFKANRLSTHTKILSIGSRAIDTNAVSYTHLTLPTTPYV